jgi:predicted nucleic acid-binding protein
VTPPHALDTNGYMELLRRAFYLDLHIAVLCRARGITLLSDDSDHARIRPYTGHRVLPLPS